MIIAWKITSVKMFTARDVPFFLRESSLSSNRFYAILSNIIRARDIRARSGMNSERNWKESGKN